MKNYEETDSRLDNVRNEYEKDASTNLDQIRAQRNYIVTGLQDMSDACEEGHHAQCHHLLHDICQCACHQQQEKFEAQGDHDEERTEKEQAEFDEDARLNDAEAEMAEEAAIEEAKERSGRGGARPGAGRKAIHTPAYDAGYNAGYQAARRRRFVVGERGLEPHISEYYADAADFWNDPEPTPNTSYSVVVVASERPGRGALVWLLLLSQQ